MTTKVTLTTKNGGESADLLSISSTTPTLTNEGTTMTASTMIPVVEIEKEESPLEDEAVVLVEEEEVEEEGKVEITPMIPDLYILPPRQKQSDVSISSSSSSSLMSSFCIALPPLRYEEQVQSIRVALMDLIPYAHYTNYRLELEIITLPESPTSLTAHDMETTISTTITNNNNNEKEDMTKSWTGKNADICMPVQCLPNINTTDSTDTSHQKQKQHHNHVNIALDEYGDLQVIGQYLETLQQSSLTVSPSETSIPNNNVKDNATNTERTKNITGLRIVLERYTMSSLREHIQRCKYLLSGGQLPTITTLYDVSATLEGNTNDTTNETNDTVMHPTTVNNTVTTTNTTTSSTSTGDDHVTTSNGANADTTKTTNGGNSEHPTDSITTVVDVDATSTTTVIKEVEQSSSISNPASNTTTLPDLQHIPKVIVDGTNLDDFFYLIFGEDRDFLHRHVVSTMLSDGTSTTNLISNHPNVHSKTTTNKNQKKKKHTKNGGSEKHINGTTSTTTSTTANAASTVTMKEYIQQYNTLDEVSRCTGYVTIQYSGYHPPPTYRKLLGDLAYLIITIPQSNHKNNHNSIDGIADRMGITTVHITCTIYGFYVNKTVDTITFDPSPAVPESHFSHALLDCLLSVSLDFRQLWTLALQAAKERSEMATTTTTHGIYQSILRTAIRGDFDGFQSNILAISTMREAFDATIASPTWLVPSLSKYATKQDPLGGWNRNACHNYNIERAEDELQRMYGMVENIRNGTITRDWNEELQIARELPVSTAQERLDRARLIHKVMMEFGEASLHAVMAIANGQVLPMNPNESIRSQVFLINNIFVSRGVDTGPETFKITRGDRAARKASNRDLSCIGIFHRLESSSSNLHTLATVLIDYLGTRYVCQSILPGILVGEKSHTLLYGSVDAGTPLKYDDDLEKTLEDKLGQNLMIAPRPIFRTPLSPERMVEIEQQRKPNMQMCSYGENKKECKNDVVDNGEFIQTCVAIEAKGILGSDKRRYMLDISRLTPRDANWVPLENGGSGKFEEINKASKQQKSNDGIVPASLDDDEWVMCVLRPELITRYTQARMKQFIDGQSKDVAKDETETPTIPANTNDKETTQPSTTESNGADTTAYLQSLKFNVNVFIPHIRRITDTTIADQIKEDEKLVRDISSYLWDDVLPKITMAVREGAVNQLPVDGKSLTEFLHRNGVNCRYLGQLAMLAHEQEEKDVIVEEELKRGSRTTIERKTMPLCWLELLECEMVARAAKHVLDEYLTANGGAAALQPAQTIASLLSALVSEAEETAAQTETRNAKRMANEGDDDEYARLTIVDVGGNGDAVPAYIKSRSEVWRDVEVEIGRRFRYRLGLFNRGNKSHRALYVPLLRRVCQRTGVILSTKKYSLGGKCLCGGGSSSKGRLIPSYPISPLDIVDVVPLMKHTAAYNEGFQLCSVGTTTVSLPPLQISFPDARAMLERAHIQANGRALGRALELAQEAGSLYQRVTDNAAHPGVIESIDLMSTIFFDAGDVNNAILNAEKALTLTIQSGGLDSAAAFNAHQLLFQMLFAAHDMERAVKHLRASMYILELMAGPRHTEQYSAYHKLGTVYSYPDYHGKYLVVALECFQEAADRESYDRLMDGFMAKNFAKTLMGLENFVDALEYERKANHTITMFLGKNHKMTHESDMTLQALSQLALERGNKAVIGDKKHNHTNAQSTVDSEAAAIADSIAADLLAEEERMANKKKVDKKKRGKK